MALENREKVSHIVMQLRLKQREAEQEQGSNQDDEGPDKVLKDLKKGQGVKQKDIGAIKAVRRSSTSGMRIYRYRLRVYWKVCIAMAHRRRRHETVVSAVTDCHAPGSRGDGHHPRRRCPENDRTGPTGDRRSHLLDRQLV
jgi:hypothetical protein